MVFSYHTVNCHSWIVSFFSVKLSLLNRKFFSRWNCHSWIIKFSRWNCHSWIVRYFRWNCHSRIIRFSRWNCHSWIVRFSLPGELNNTVRIRTGEMRYNRKSYDSRETGTTNSVEEIGYDGYWYSNAIIRAVWFWIGLLRLGFAFLPHVSPSKEQRRIETILPQIDIVIQQSPLETLLFRRLRFENFFCNSLSCVRCGGMSLGSTVAESWSKTAF